MRIEYELTPDDLRQEIRHRLFKSMAYRRWWLISYILFGLIFAFVLLYATSVLLPLSKSFGDETTTADGTLLEDERAIPCFMIVLGAFVLMMFLWPRNKRRMADKCVEKSIRRYLEHDFLFGPRTVELRDQGIHVHYGGGDKLTKWVAVKSIAVDSEYVCIARFVESDLLIPVKAFANAQEMAGFVERANQLREQALSAPPEQPG